MLHRGRLRSGRSSVAHDPRAALAIQRPPRPLRPVEHRLWPTAGGETAVLRRRGNQLRPRPAGTRVRYTAETCYASCSVDF